MELHLLHYVFTFLFLSLVVVSHAAHVAELYWDTVLHNTSMPKAVKDLLKSDHQTSRDVYPQSSSSPLFDYGGYAAKHQILNTYYPQSSDSPFSYHYAAKQPPHNDNKSIPTLFFFEKDLQMSTNMNLKFVKSSNAAPFLPRKVADSIPFTSREIPEIFNRLSVNPSSREAQVMINTIKQCEELPIKQEDKYCATSLESMIEFTTSKLGRGVEAMSSEAENATNLQSYSILGLKKMGSEKAIVCHQQNYPYAVFYCHKTYATKIYMVSLVGAHGGKAEAVAVCHEDTSAWSPRHLAFVLLKVKPGRGPICHFLPEDHVVWIPK